MHPYEELIRRESEAWRSGDVEAVLALYTPEAVYHYPGQNPLAGDYRGHEGIRELHRKRTRLIQAVDEAEAHYHDFIANDEHGVQLVHWLAAKGGRNVEWHAVHVYHFRDGKLDHTWVHLDSQQAVDDFLTHLESSIGQS